jgi:AraC-like DNA-binding protein
MYLPGSKIACTWRLEKVSERINQGESFDILRDILETLRFKGTIFFRSDLASPWGLSLSKSHVPRFHIVLSGECFIGTDSHEAVRARQADIVVLPAGSPHWIADAPGRALTPSETAGLACELGNPLFQNGTVTSRIMCGRVQFDHGSSHPIIDTLPDIMHFEMLDPAGPIWSVVQLIDGELQQRRQKDNPIVDRLTEVLFLQLLNGYVNDSANTGGFLAALRDRRVFRALTLIHREPAFNWTLSSLGGRVGMSKATLVRRFQEIVGVAPMAYITDWRIMKARNLVVHATMPLEQIAERTGFASARTLSKTFKHHYGCSPSAMRRTKAG